MVRKVGVHDNDEVTGSELQAVDVCGSETEFAGAGLEQDLVLPVSPRELLGYVLRAVRGGVVDDYELPGEVLLGEGAVQEPDDDGQVAALIVGGDNDGVLVCGCHSCV